MKKILITIGAAVTAVTLLAAEETKVEADEAEDKALEVGFDFDFLSAYVWRNAIQNDEMVMQPCVWADFAFLDPFSAGFSVWQNYDLTNRRGGDLRKGLTETDYNVHVGATAWESEDGEMSFGLELGHEWYVSQFVASDSRTSFPDTREIYLKATFDNPIVNVYGQTSWLYEDFGDYKQGVHYELGFNKEIEVVDSVTVGADWNVSFGTSRYLEYLYGKSAAGFGGTTVKLYTAWQVCENFSLGACIAYTGVLNASCRDSLKDEDDWWGSDGYQRDYVWGGIQAKISF